MIISKAQKGQIINARGIIVGIDVAKHQHHAKILFPDGSESAVLRFYNNHKGFHEFICWIFRFRDKAKCNSIIVGLESTGHYWEPLAFFLDTVSGIRLVQVNPKHIKKTKELYDNSPGKTDSKDAGLIAMLIRIGRYQRLVLPRGPFAQLRSYGKLREQKVVELGVQRNILHSLVDRVFPEYGTIFKKIESKTSLRILKQYTTPGRMLRIGCNRLTAVIRRASHGKLSKACAAKLREAACTTVGLKEGIDALSFAIRKTVCSIESIQKDIAVIEGALKRELMHVPYAAQLSTIPGVGTISLSIILGEAGDLKRYQKAEELIKLAGLNLYEISSGKHQGKRHISKRGRSLLRKCLFFAALRTVKTGGAFRKEYLRLTENNHMLKTKALVAISRKILRVVFALVRDKVEYNQKGIALRAA